MSEQYGSSPEQEEPKVLDQLECLGSRLLADDKSVLPPGEGEVDVPEVRRYDRELTFEQLEGEELQSLLGDFVWQKGTISLQSMEDIDEQEHLFTFELNALTENTTCHLEFYFADRDENAPYVNIQYRDAQTGMLLVDNPDLESHFSVIQKLRTPGINQKLDADMLQTLSSLLDQAETLSPDNQLSAIELLDRIALYEDETIEDMTNRQFSGLINILLSPQSRSYMQRLHEGFGHELYDTTAYAYIDFDETVISSLEGSWFSGDWVDGVVSVSRSRFQLPNEEERLEPTFTQWHASIELQGKNAEERNIHLTLRKSDDGSEQSDVSIGTIYDKKAMEELRHQVTRAYEKNDMEEYRQLLEKTVEIRQLNSMFDDLESDSQLNADDVAQLTELLIAIFRN